MILRTLEHKDIDGMLEWLHESDIHRFFRLDMMKLDRTYAFNFIEDASNLPEDGKSIHYAIADENAELAISLRK